MKQTRHILTATAVTLAFGLGVAACSAPGGSMSSSSPRGHSTVTAPTNEPAMPTDTSPGPAHRTISGKVVKISGVYYDVLEYTGTRVRLHVNNKTVKINGDKKVGDMIRAEITKGGHANSIQ